MLLDMLTIFRMRLLAIDSQLCFFIRGLVPKVWLELGAAFVQGYGMPERADDSVGGGEG